jgi:hypothetical protein
MRRASTNEDLLEWFSDEERVLCSACGKNTCVGFPDVPASFCLACDAITVDGVRLDTGRQAPLAD